MDARIRYRCAGLRRGEAGSSHAARPVAQGRQAAGDSGDPPEVIIADVAKHRTLHLVTAQPGGICLVAFFFFQGTQDLGHI